MKATTWSVLLEQRMEPACGVTMTKDETIRLQAAEIERLRDVIDRAAKAWISLEPGVAWEGDVGGAMVAAVAEIERLRGLVYAVPPTENMPGIAERMAAQTWKEACEANRDEVARLDNMLRTYRLPDEVVDIKVVIELRAEIERLREALEFVLEVARWHFDGDADPRNESPEDMTAHINGLIVQRVREALGE